MNNEPQSTSTIATLLRDLRRETGTLVEKEVELVKTELTEKITELITNAVQIGIGASVAYAGAIILLLGLADLVATILIRSGVDADMATWMARATVGVIIAVIGFVLINRARKAISQEGVAPEKTIQTMRDNKEWAQDKIQQQTQ